MKDDDKQVHSFFLNQTNTLYKDVVLMVARQPPKLKVLVQIQASLNLFSFPISFTYYKQEPSKQTIYNKH